MSPIGGLMVWLIVLGAIVLVGPHPGPVFSTVAVLALLLATLSQLFGGARR